MPPSPSHRRTSTSAAVATGSSAYRSLRSENDVAEVLQTSPTLKQGIATRRSSVAAKGLSVDTVHSNAAASSSRASPTNPGSNGSAPPTSATYGMPQYLRRRSSVIAPQTSATSPTKLTNGDVRPMGSAHRSNPSPTALNGRKTSLFAEAVAAMNPFGVNSGALRRPSSFRLDISSSTASSSPISPLYPPGVQDKLFSSSTKGTRSDSRRISVGLGQIHSNAAAAAASKVGSNARPRRRLILRVLIIIATLYGFITMLSNWSHQALMIPDWIRPPNIENVTEKTASENVKDQLPAAFTEFLVGLGEAVPTSAISKDDTLAKTEPTLSAGQESESRPQHPTRPKKKPPVYHGPDTMSRSEMKKKRAELLWSPPTAPLETMSVPPASGQQHENTVIMIHGLQQYAGEVNMHGVIGEHFSGTKWVMPQAKDKHISLLENKLYPAWFNMRAFPYVYATDQDEDSLYASARELNQVIEHERDELVKSLRARGGLTLDDLHQVTRGRSSAQLRKEVTGELGTRAEKDWANQRIILGGFSQGGVMTILTGLTHKYQLGGLFVFSGFMPMRTKLPQFAADLHRKNVPMFWGHGEEDIYLLEDDAAVSVDLLRADSPDENGQGGLGLQNLQYMTYPGLEHTWFEGELVDFVKWMRLVMNLQNPGH